MADSDVETFCPHCDGPVRVVAVRCPHCGEPFETARNRRGINGFVWGGVASLVLLAPAAFYLFFAFTPPHPQAACIFGGVLFALGLLPAGVAATLAWFDLRGIHSGRLNPDRKTGTFVGLWACVLTLLLYWATLGYCITRLF